MLIIGRRIGQTFFIKNKETGDEIKITLTSQSGSQIRLGIEADMKYNVVREEILDGPPNKEAPPRNPGSACASKVEKR